MTQRHRGLESALLLAVLHCDRVRTRALPPLLSAARAFSVGGMAPTGEGGAACFAGTWQKLPYSRDVNEPTEPVRLGGLTCGRPGAGENMPMSRAVVLPHPGAVNSCLCAACGAAPPLPPPRPVSEPTEWLRLGRRTGEAQLPPPPLLPLPPPLPLPLQLREVRAPTDADRLGKLIRLEFGDASCCRSAASWLRPASDIGGCVGLQSRCSPRAVWGACEALRAGGW